MESADPRTLRFSARAGWNLTPNRLMASCARLAGLGRRLLDLTVTNPTRVDLPYPYESLARELSGPGILAYDPTPRGLGVAREALAGWYRDRGQPVDPDRIMLFASTSEAYAQLFKLLCDPGDEVLAPAPSYPLFEYLAGLEDVSLRAYRLTEAPTGWHLDPTTLDRGTSGRPARAVLAVHPNNPTGSYLTPDEIGQLVLTCRERDLALIADEVFWDFPIEADRGAGAGAGARASFAGIDEVVTFSLGGLSKLAGLPQLKLSWLVASGPAGPVREAMERLGVIQDAYLTVSTPVQLALPGILQSSRLTRDAIALRLTGNLAVARTLVAGTSIDVMRVEGGWSAILKVPRLASDEDLALGLLETAGVLVHPGYLYDFDREGRLVVSLLCRPDLFEEGLEAVRTWFMDRA